MKKIFTSIIACLFSFSCLIACEVEIALGADGNYYYAIVTADGDWSLIWPDGSNGDAYPLLPDQPTVCVTLISDAGDCNITECFTTIDPDFCGADLYLNDANNICIAAEGEGPFTYFWDCGAVEECIEYMGPMDYCVTVVDATGCVVELCEFFSLEEDCSVTIVPQINGAWLQALPVGEAPFTYAWSDGHGCPIIEVVPGVDYCVTITDAAGCVATSCYGGNPDCSVEIIWDPAGFNLLLAVADGVAPFEYLWNTGETTENVSVEQGVDYCVTITDATGCVAEACFFPLPDCAVEIVVDQISEEEYILIALVVGNGAISYDWSNGEVGAEILVQEAGTYCVITHDETGCASEACVTVGESSCVVSIEATELDIAGQVQLSASGIGNGPFEFLWSTAESGPSIIVSESGEYCVEMTNGFGCLASSCYFLIIEDCTVEIIEVIDANGELALFAATPGGEQDYYYTWSDGSAGAYLYNPAPGDSYCVTIENDLGCSASDCWNNTNCGVEIIIETTSTGEHVLQAIGIGQAPYTFLWDHGEIGEVITVFEPGIYCVSMVDGAGCTAETCIIIDQFPCSVSIQGSGTPELTHLTAEAFGTAPFEYQWSTGEVSQTIEVNEQGTYCVEVIDVTGCVAMGCFEVVDPPSNCIVFIWEENNSTGNYLNALALSDAAVSYNWSTGETTATIGVDEPGEYCVTVEMETGSSCSACYFFDFPIVTQEIRGLIHLPDPNASSIVKVELFLLVDGAPADLIGEDIVEVNPGFESQYYFADAPEGEFIVRATEIEGIVPPTYAPTYHFMSLVSEEAAIISNPHNLSTWYSILMMPLEGNSEGPGVIGGNVIDGTGRSIDEAGINVILTDLEGTPVEYQPTVLDGSFNMNDLAFGEYFLLVDVPGLPLAKERINITSEQPIHDEVQIIIEEGSIVLGTKDLHAIVLKAYPNPAQDYIRILGLEGNAASLSYQLFSANGQLHKLATAIDVNDQIDISELAAGLYFLQLQANDQLHTIKLIKKN